MPHILQRLQEAPPEAWFALIGALTGGLLALIGVWLTNRSSLQRLIIQLHDERTQRHRENLRLRHEELYVESRKYFDALVSHFFMYRGVIGGELLLSEALDMTSARADSTDYQYHRVTMLIDLYLPKLRESFDDILSVRDNLSTLVNSYKASQATEEGKALYLPVFQKQLKALDDKVAAFNSLAVTAICE